MDDSKETMKPSSDCQTNLNMLADQFRQTLNRLGYQQLNGIECTSVGDEIRLTGRLDSFYLKQVAQSVAIKIPGVRSVKNEIQVN